MPRPLKGSILGAHTIILSKNIHKVTKTDYVWFEFLWIRRYMLIPTLHCTNVFKLISIISYLKELNCTTGDWLYDKFEDVSNNSVDPRNQYCIGHSWSKDHTLWYKGLEETRYGCETPCNGDTPCIR